METRNSKKFLTNLELVFLAVTLSLVFSILIYESFASSQALDFLGWRGEDDLPFQMVLRETVSHFKAGKFSDVLRTNDFGYGFLFWIIYSFGWGLVNLITTGKSFHEAALVAIPSLISSGFFVGGMVFLYGTLKNLYIRKVDRVLLFLVFCTFPCYGYFASKFHPTAPAFAFTSTAIYYATVRDHELDRLANVVFGFLTLGLALRLTGAFAYVPCSIILAIRGLGIKRLMRIASVSFSAATLLYFPIILVEPLNGNSWEHVVAILRQALWLTGNIGHNEIHENPLFIFSNMLLNHFMTLSVAGIFIASWLLSAIRSSRKTRLERVGILLFLIFFIVYLSFRAKVSPHYNISYIIPITPLFAYAFTWVNEVSNGWGFSLLFLSTSVAQNRANLTCTYNDYLASSQIATTTVTKFTFDDPSRRNVCGISSFNRLRFFQKRLEFERAQIQELRSYIAQLVGNMRMDDKSIGLDESFPPIFIGLDGSPFEVVARSVSSILSSQPKIVLMRKSNVENSFFKSHYILGAETREFEVLIKTETSDQHQISN